jgi:uncharacterized phage-associated protein
MPSVFDADTYLQSLGCSGLTVRMKLLYDANRLSVRLQRTFLFDARCEAWKNGPVYLALWNRPDDYGDPTNLAPVAKAILDFVFARLGRASGKRLSERSHDFPEWVKSREGLAATDTGNREITFADIKEALSHELHVEEGGIVCIPNSPDYIGRMKNRLKEVVFLGTVLQPLFATKASVVGH